MPGPFRATLPCSRQTMLRLPAELVARIAELCSPHDRLALRAVCRHLACALPLAECLRGAPHLRARALTRSFTLDPAAMRGVWDLAAISVEDAKKGLGECAATGCVATMDALVSTFGLTAEDVSRARVLTLCGAHGHVDLLRYFHTVHGLGRVDVVSALYGPFTDAAGHGHVAVLRVLKELYGVGPPWGHNDLYLCEAVDVAARGGHAAVLLVLHHEFGAGTVHATAFSCNTPLTSYDLVHLTATGGHADALRVLLREYGLGQQPLYSDTVVETVAAGHAEALQILLRECELGNIDTVMQAVAAANGARLHSLDDGAGRVRLRRRCRDCDDRLARGVALPLCPCRAHVPVFFTL